MVWNVSVHIRVISLFYKVFFCEAEIVLKYLKLNAYNFFEDMTYAYYANCVAQNFHFHLITY